MNNNRNKILSYKYIITIICIVFIIAIIIYRNDDITASANSNTIIVSNTINTNNNKQYNSNDLLLHDKDININELHTIIDKTNNAIDSIHSYWNISYYPKFLTMMNIPTLSWDMQKAKLIKLIIESQYYEVDYVAGFSGSSVTAGHDNYFNESYPQVFYRTMLPVFEAIGVANFVVRNHALGNNPCFPYDACIATHLGDDLDLLSWEQSMNCGRWSIPLDTFSRQASYMPKKPTLLYTTSGSPYWPPSDCFTDRNHTISDSNIPLSSGWSRSASMLSIEDREILSEANTNIRKTALRNDLLQQFSFLIDSDKSLLKDRFATLAPMAQSTLGCAEYKCYGPYSAQFSMKSPGQNDNTIGGGKDHHPGKLGHKLRGDNLAFFLLQILKEAVQSVTEVTKIAQHSNMQLLNDIQHTLKLSAVQEDSMYDWNSHENEEFIRHNCHPNSGGCSTTSLLYWYVTTYLTTISNKPLPPVPASYNTPELSHPPTCYTDYEPRMTNSLDSIIMPEFSNWNRELAFLDKSVVEKSDARGLGYIDKKYIYISTGLNSSLSVVVNVTNGASRLWLAELQKGFQQYPPSTHTDIDSGADIYVKLNYKRYLQQLHSFQTNSKLPNLSIMTKISKLL